MTLLLTHTLVAFPQYLHFSPAEDINTPATASLLLAFRTETEFSLSAAAQKVADAHEHEPCGRAAGLTDMLPANKSFGLPVKRVAPLPFSFTAIRKAAGGEKNLSPSVCLF